MEILLIIVVCFLAGYGLYNLIRDIRTINHDPQREHDIVFPHPRALMPGDRLGRFRIKRARVNPQKFEGNEVRWKFPCDHAYFPTRDIHSGMVTGQQCAICQKFNSMADLGLEG